MAPPMTPHPMRATLFAMIASLDASSGVDLHS